MDYSISIVIGSFIALSNRAMFFTDEMAFSLTIDESLIHLNAKIGDFGYAAIVGASDPRRTTLVIHQHLRRMCI